jgi:hypothetical protein
MSKDCVVDLTNLMPVEFLKGDSEEDTRLLRQMALEAESFLKG